MSIERLSENRLNEWRKRVDDLHEEELIDHIDAIEAELLDERVMCEARLQEIADLHASIERLRAVNTDLYRELESDQRKIARLNKEVDRLSEQSNRFLDLLGGTHD